MTGADTSSTAGDAMIDLLLERAAKYDALGVDEAGLEMTDWLDFMPLSRMQLCAAVAVLALRVHRQVPDA